MSASGPGELTLQPEREERQPVSLPAEYQRGPGVRKNAGFLGLLTRGFVCAARAP